MGTNSSHFQHTFHNIYVCLSGTDPRELHIYTSVYQIDSNVYFEGCDYIVVYYRSHSKES